MAVAASNFKPIVLRAIRECGGNVFALPADLGKDELVKFARSVKNGELMPFPYHGLEEDLSGLASSRFKGTASECCDSWLSEKLAVFFAAWERKHPGDVSIDFIQSAVSEIHFWVRECVSEGFVFSEYAEDYYPPSLPDDLYNQAIRLNPVYWAIFDVIYEVSFSPDRPILDLVEAFRKPLFDTRFIYLSSQMMRETNKKRAA